MAIRSLGETIANNMHHCLHQFMSQMLLDAPTIAIDSWHKHLGITVGVITRNRAGDLAELLESLTCQVRPPDEVLWRTTALLMARRQCLRSP